MFIALTQGNLWNTYYVTVYPFCNLQWDFMESSIVLRVTFKTLVTSNCAPGGFFLLFHCNSSHRVLNLGVEAVASRENDAEWQIFTVSSVMYGRDECSQHKGGSKQRNVSFAGLPFLSAVACSHLVVSLYFTSQTITVQVFSFSAALARM